MPKLRIDDNSKLFRSESYNYNFDKHTGYFERWGAKHEDNPEYSEYGPEIADIEISTVCHGVDKPCKFCYKSNTGKGINMSLETFKNIFHKFPKTLTQIAFGIGDIDANKDLYKILKYCRENDYNQVIPNITINGSRLTDDHIKILKNTVGAIAVSRYEPKDICYDAVKRLTDYGIGQVNIHQLVHSQNLEQCLETLDDVKNDPRLKKLRAVVFLSMKPKGSRNNMSPLKDRDKFKQLIDKAFENEVSFGFDSCSAPKFLEAVKGTKYFEQYSTMAESCEANLFSIYVNAEGKTFQCSFIEGQKGYKGIDLTKIDNFYKDVWFNKSVKRWRKKLLDTNKKCEHLGSDCRMCPEFDIY